MSFSEDTGMAECLVIARKHGSDSSAETHETASARFTSLQKSPSNFVEAAILADQIVNADAPAY